MKKIINTILTILLVAHSALWSQSSYTGKYWNYRDSVLPKFISIGSGSGMSLPASWRDSADQKMSWSDNTIILGWYIGMLATEFHLLHENFYPDFSLGRQNAVSRNKTELFYALMALGRLDSIAEQSFHCDTSYTSINGFFIRDDVPQDFHANFPGINVLESDFTSSNVYNKEMSQDQAYHLLLGLSLVKAYIPDTLQLNGIFIQQEAINQALLILDWIQQANWIIKNPVCSLAGQSKNVSRGADAELLSAGISKMASFFSDGSIDYDAKVTAQNQNIWNFLRDPGSPAYQNEDNMHMTMCIAAVGNAWGSGSFTDLMNLATVHRWYVYPMLNAALQNLNSSKLEGHLDTLNFWTAGMLAEAPWQGPYSIYPQQNNHGYAVNIRFLHERSKHYLGNTNSGGQKYTGLDFMLLHNLYYIINASLVGIAAKDELAPQLKIFPNPFSNKVTICSENRIAGFSIEIYNVNGMKMGRWNFSDKKEEIDLDFPESGIYLIKIADAEGNQWVKKLIKN